MPGETGRVKRSPSVLADRVPHFGILRDEDPQNADVTLSGRQMKRSPAILVHQRQLGSFLKQKFDDLEGYKEAKTGVSVYGLRINVSTLLYGLFPTVRITS